jgi:hypothetical protein
MSDIQLQPGQTVVVRITNHLEYRITHTGWVLDVASSQPIGVRPVSDKALTIISHGQVQDDDV